jgi:hypothetical protein
MKWFLSAAALLLAMAPAVRACECQSKYECAPPTPVIHEESPSEGPMVLAAGGGGLLVLGGATLLVVRRGMA